MVRRISILSVLLLFAWGNIVFAAPPPQVEAEAAVLMVLGDNPEVLMMFIS